MSVPTVDRPTITEASRNAERIITVTPNGDGAAKAETMIRGRRYRDTTVGDTLHYRGTVAEMSHHLADYWREFRGREAHVFVHSPTIAVVYVQRRQGRGR